MLNILKIKQNNKNLIYNKSLINNDNNINKYSPSTKQWIDSIYTYNNVNSKTLISKNNMVSKLFVAYFNSEFITIKSNKIIRDLIRFNYRSSKKVYLSKPEIKHTNDKAFITVYAYNKKQSILLNELMLKLVMMFRPKNLEKLNIIKSKLSKSKLKILLHFTKKLTLLRNKSILEIKKLYKSYKNLITFTNKINKIGKYLNITEKDKNLVIDFKSDRNLINKNIFNLENWYRALLKKKYIFKTLKRLLYINRTLFIESKKTNDLYLNLHSSEFSLIALLKKIYNKNIQIDVVNHKALHLNSEIISKVITFKLKDRKILPFMVFKKIFNFKVPLRYLLLINNKKDLKENVLDNLKYKVVNGVRFEITGRFTKRLTATRSSRHLKYIGGLKNIDSSYKGLSTLMLRNNVNPNLQYTKSSGKTRNGAYGLKCWISSN